MFDFAQSIRDKRPKLRDTSVNAYATSLKTLAPEGGKNTQDLTFLKDTEEVLSKLEKYKPNTRKNHLNAAVVVLQESTDPEFVAAVKIYERFRDKYQEEYLDQVKTHQKTPSQEANWIEWPEYELMVKHLSDGVKWRGEMTGKDKMRFQEYLVALLHMNFPVRNDFANLVVVSMKQWKAMPTLEQTERNYYIHGQNFHRFVLNQYKTSDKYGQRVLEVKGWPRHCGAGTGSTSRRTSCATARGSLWTATGSPRHSVASGSVRRGRRWDHPSYVTRTCRTSITAWRRRSRRTRH